MKKFIQFSVAAVLIAGLSACGTSAPSAAPSNEASASPTATQAKRAVPDVVGMTYKEAYNTLVKGDFFAQPVDETGAKWVQGNPWDDVKVVSTDPAAGTMTDTSYVNVTFNMTQAAYADLSKAAK
ncbi:PASTA domain-containing protein [Arthrobacter sp. GMC3]|uniref:PASTA domain-containing protein n=1 Tax=Arthrobacter sp. GMC3 TaxID=2058894 RepID=UPI0015E2816D|nr:PASTA domain-containing protein [Arthrobacter sp. GMC3]